MHMASIHKSFGKWRVQIRKKGFPTLTEHFDTKREADAFASITESKMITGRYIDTNEAKNFLFSDALDKFEQEEADAGRKSIRQLRSQLKMLRLTNLAQMSVLNIKPKDLIAYKNKRIKEVKVTSYHKDHNLLHRLFQVIMIDWAIHLPLGNPMKLVPKPRSKVADSRERRLEENEEELLLEDLNKTSYETAIVVMLALETGMRRGEIMNMEVNHIDMKNQQLSIPETKTGKPRNIPLSKQAFHAIAKRMVVILNRVQQVYPKEFMQSVQEVTSKGKVVNINNSIRRTKTPQNEKGFKLFRMKADSITRAFNRACKRQGINDLTFHDLRHEATSRLFEYGLDMMEVSHITGHKDLKMLKRYTHLKPINIANKINSFRDKSQ